MLASFHLSGWHTPCFLLLLPLSVAATPLGGCTAIQNNLAHAVAAPPLAVDTAAYGGNVLKYCSTVESVSTGADAPTSAIKNPAGGPAEGGIICAEAMANDSQQKCGAFLNRVTGNKIAWDTGLNIAGLAGSAVASVVSPVPVARGFSTAASIITGSRTAIESDIYANAGPGDFATAIHSTYDSDMEKFRSDLAGLTKPGADTVTANTFDARSALLTVRAIHEKCSLDAAEATIKATLAQASAKPATPAGTPDASLQTKSATPACAAFSVAPAGSPIKPRCGS